MQRISSVFALKRPSMTKSRRLESLKGSLILIGSLLKRLRYQLAMKSWSKSLRLRNVGKSTYSGSAGMVVRRFSIFGI